MAERIAWPEWLAGLNPEQMPRRILNAVAACYGGDDHDQPATQHCTVSVAEMFLLRLLDEARAGSAPELARLAELENALNWGTTCTSCAAVLDSAIRETNRAETAEVQLAQAVAALTRLALDERMTEPGVADLHDEIAAMREHAAGALDTVRQLGGMAPAQPPGRPGAANAPGPVLDDPANAHGGSQARLDVPGFLAGDQRRKFQSVVAANERASIICLLRDKAAGLSGSDPAQSVAYSDAADLIEGEGDLR
jgi:hypothetical protein